MTHRISAVTAVVCAATGALAQPYFMESSTIDGGGGTLAGLTYSLSGTIGQADAGVLEGSTYSLAGGFWTTSGPSGCNAADLAEPFGVLDLSDISTFVGAFTSGMSPGDIDGNGIFDLADISGFVSAFTAGCP